MKYQIFTTEKAEEDLESITNSLIVVGIAPNE